MKKEWEKYIEIFLKTFSNELHKLKKIMIIIILRGNILSTLQLRVKMIIKQNKIKLKQIETAICLYAI